MYLDYFGLKQVPFYLTPDPDSLYLTTQHREALAGLLFSLFSRRGFVVLTGDAGTGQTTLIRRTRQSASGDRMQTSLIVNPTLSPAEFLEAALMDFGLTPIPDSKARRIAMLQEFLWETHRQGKVAALIVDEAHKLTTEVLEEIRMFGNFESASEKLLQVVLVGQVELDEMLATDTMSQFKQRISLRLTVGALAEADILPYMQHRWTRAGGGTPPFTAEAVAAIGRASKGVPRVINLLCDNCLMLAFGEQARAVERRHVAEVCRDLQFDIGPTVKRPAPVLAERAPVVDLYAMPTLVRYETQTTKPSLPRRIFGWLKLTLRTETA